MPLRWIGRVALQGRNPVRYQEGEESRGVEIVNPVLSGATLGSPVARRSEADKVAEDPASLGALSSEFVVYILSIEQVQHPTRFMSGIAWLRGPARGRLRRVAEDAATLAPKSEGDTRRRRSDASTRVDDERSKPRSSHGRSLGSLSLAFPQNWHQLTSK
jgi:hypothetical protein